HLVHIGRPAALNPKSTAQASCLLEVASDNPHFGGRLQGGGNRPRRSAGSDDRDTAIPPTPTLPQKGGGRFAPTLPHTAAGKFAELPHAHAPEPLEICVAAPEPYTLLPDGVHRADANP